MTQEAIIWMITVEVPVTLTTLFLFYKVLKKDGKKGDEKSTIIKTEPASGEDDLKK